MSQEKLGENLVGMKGFLNHPDTPQPLRNRRYVYHLININEIPHIRTSPKKILFDMREIRRWLKKKTVNPVD